MIRQASRDEYITECGDWLPENKDIHLAILAREAEGRLEFYKENDEFIILNNQTKEEVRYDKKNNTWSK